jgi:hypothetical protein
MLAGFEMAAAFDFAARFLSDGRRQKSDAQALLCTSRRQLDST